jgi:hypothetical protein
MGASKEKIRYYYIIEDWWVSQSKPDYPETVINVSWMTKDGHDWRQMVLEGDLSAHLKKGMRLQVTIDPAAVIKNTPFTIANSQGRGYYVDRCHPDWIAVRAPDGVLVQSFYYERWGKQYAEELANKMANDLNNKQQ